jgi:6-pyruvoyl-tetrahydropterin synthase
MRPINGTIENDLTKLKGFVSQPKIYGYVSNLWFGGLVSKYPFEYLLFSQEFDFQQYKKQQTQENIKKRVILKLDKILKRKLSEDEISDLNQIMSLVDKISAKKL